MYNCPWSDIVAAVQRKYESVRRQWKMEENLGDDFVEMSRQLSVARKYRARRKRVSILCLILVMCLQSMTNFLTLQKFESRALVVQPDEVCLTGAS